MLLSKAIEESGVKYGEDVEIEKWKYNDEDEIVVVIKGQERIMRIRFDNK